MIKIIYGIILTLILTSYCRAQPFSLNQGGTNQKDYYSQISYEKIIGKIIVSVTIKKKQYRFILDTGAPNGISKSLYNELKPQTLSRKPVIDQSGASDSMLIVSMDSISIGGIVFNNIPTMVIENSNILDFLDCFNTDGLIGSNMLRNSIVRFSSMDKTITLTDNKKKLLLNKTQSSELLLSRSQSNPYIWVKHKNKKKAREQILFDSGMGDFYSLSLNHFQFFHGKNIIRLNSQGFGSNTLGLHGVAKDTIQYRVSVPEMVINGASFRNLSFQTTSDNDSRIGAKLLDYGVVTVDYKNKKFYFEPFSIITNLDDKHFPISPTFIDEKLVVGIVWGKNYQNQITVGSSIIEINNENFENTKPCDFLTKLSPFLTLDRMQLILKDKGGVLKSITIEKE